MFKRRSFKELPVDRDMYTTIPLKGGFANAKFGESQFKEDLLALVGRDLEKAASSG